MPQPSFPKFYIALFPLRMSEIKLRLRSCIDDLVSSDVKVAHNFLLYSLIVFQFLLLALAKTSTIRLSGIFQIQTFTVGFFRLKVQRMERTESVFIPAVRHGQILSMIASLKQLRVISLIRLELLANRLKHPRLGLLAQAAPRLETGHLGPDSFISAQSFVQEIQLLEALINVGSVVNDIVQGIESEGLFVLMGSHVLLPELYIGQEQGY